MMLANTTSDYNLKVAENQSKTHAVFKGKLV